MARIFPVGEMKKARGSFPRARLRLGLSPHTRLFKFSECGRVAQTHPREPLSIAAPVAARYGIARFARMTYQDPMTTFDERGQGFERKFALDQEQEFKAQVRRNRALGQWAAGLMGLEGQHVDDYAKAVVKSDFELPGEEDVFRKVFEDLKGSGVAVTEGEVRMKMAELLAQAREAVKNGV